MPSILRILYVFEIPLFSQIVFAYEKRYCIFDILLPSFNHLHSATTEVGNERCSTTQADTSFIVVDSTLLLYLKKNTSDKEIYAVLEERPEYPGGMKEAINIYRPTFSILLLPYTRKYKGEFG